MCGTCKQDRRVEVDLDEAPIAGEPAATAAAQPIKAVVAPGYDAKVSVRIVPGRDIKDILTEPPRPTCQPRGDRPYGLRPGRFPVELVDKLTEVNGTVTAWLAKDPGNAAAFLDDPVAALAEAGVELSRAEAKAVSRSHAAVKEEAILPPGARITTLDVVGVKRGKVGDRKPGEFPGDREATTGRVPDAPADTTHDRPGKPARGGCGCS